MSLPHCCSAAHLCTVHSFRDSSVEALEVISKNSGGAQSAIMRCSDDNLYAVKMSHNPQGSRVLINEALGSLLLNGLGFPTPTPRLIWVGQHLIDTSPLLSFEVSISSYRPEKGLHFGSQLVPYSHKSDEAGPIHGTTNMSQLTGIRLFDLWANHTDRRQYLYRYDFKKRHSTISFIDHGHLFGGPEWRNTVSTHWPSRHLRELRRDDPALALWLERFKQVLPELLEEASEVVNSVWTISNISSFIRCFQDRIDILEGLVTLSPALVE